MIDWLEDFNDSFDGHALIKRLKDIKFHGKLELNFNEGRVHTATAQMCCKAGVPMILPYNREKSFPDDTSDSGWIDR